MENKKVLIVGGSSGIGLAVAQLAYGAGAIVIIASRHASDNHHALSQCVGADISTVSLDVTSEASLDALTQHGGNVDHLVICVRPDIQSTAFMNTDILIEKRGFETKFWGQYRLIQHMAPYVNQDGSIIMTSGIAGEKVFPHATTMGVINVATETLCKFLAVELAPVRVNVVSPGFVVPKPESIVDRARQFPIGRLADVAEVAQAYLCLMNAAYTTGSVFHVDGGVKLI